MTRLQDKSLAHLEWRLGETRADTERRAAELIPGFCKEDGLADIDADHMIFFLSDLDIRRRHDHLSD